METNQKNEDFSNRENKKQIFDKRLVKAIVKSVEEGIPRREIIAQHGMTKGTLAEWMRKYGSAAYQASKRQIYSSLQKRSILRAIESGMTIKEAQVSFGLKDTAIVRRWIRESKQENIELSLDKSITMAKQSDKKGSDEVKALQQALAEAELKIQALNTMIDIAEEQLKVSIRKKSGARQSPK